MSTQKLPMPCAEPRPRPRQKAMATAIPAAAEKKLCDANATICEKYDIVFSPE